METANAATPFFGAKISLISKSEIRYEGVLYTIDPKESTIALAKVRSFGTEDRPTERPVPARDEIFEFIIFRASDIKDLIVDDPPKQNFTDPAIIQAQPTGSSAFSASISSGPSSSQAGQSPSSSQQQPLQKAQKTTTDNVAQADAVKKSQGGQATQKSAWGGVNQQQQNQQRNQTSRQNASLLSRTGTNQSRVPALSENDGDRPTRNNFQTGIRGGFRFQNQGYRNNQGYNNQGRFNGQRGGTGGFRGGRFGRGGFHQRSDRNIPLKFAPLPEGEFDFEKAYSDFKLLEDLQKVSLNGNSDQEIPTIDSIDKAITVSALEEEELPKEPCYNKTKSFFDNISCEALEREKGGVKRIDRKAERTLNKETFGIATARPPQRFYGNRRGYGFNRNGGFGRGRGGGGFNQNRRFGNQNRESTEGTDIAALVSTPANSVQASA